MSFKHLGPSTMKHYIFIIIICRKCLTVPPTANGTSNGAAKTGGMFSFLKNINFSTQQTVTAESLAPGNLLIAQVPCNVCVFVRA